MKNNIKYIRIKFNHSGILFSLTDLKVSGFSLSSLRKKD